MNDYVWLFDSNNYLVRMDFEELMEVNYNINNELKRKA